MLRPSVSSTWFLSGCTRAAPTAMKSMFFLFRYGAASRVTSSRLRQFTATQGLDGVNWKYELLEMTVTLSSARADSRIS